MNVSAHHTLLRVIRDQLNLTEVKYGCGRGECCAHQGLGFVLTAEYDYNARGLVLNADFTDYKMLGPSDIPNATIILVESDLRRHRYSVYPSAHHR